MSSQWLIKYNSELQHGLQARTEGNEGMARVCARRAAGEVVREFFRRQNLTLPKPSALHALKTLTTFELVSLRTREIATHFVWQITTEHTLPGEVDLLAEVQWLVHELLGEGERPN